MNGNASLDSAAIGGFDAARLLVALQQQVEGYLRLAKLASLQRQCIQQQRTEQLLEILQRRQVELDQIGRLEGMIAPARRQWSWVLTQLDETQRPEAEALLARTRELLERITSADRDDVLLLQQRKLNLGRQINQARTAGRVNRHYANAAYGRPAATVDLGG